eukprot:3644398-Pyramimonas_sp.AAC.1
MDHSQPASIFLDERATDGGGAGCVGFRSFGGDRPSVNYPRPSVNYPRPSVNYPRPSANYPRPSANYPRSSANGVVTSATASLVAPAAAPPASLAPLPAAAAVEVEEEAASDRVRSSAAKAPFSEAFSARSSHSSLSAAVANASASGLNFRCST